MTLPPGVRIGHWTDRRARTGCTVVLAHPAAVVSGDIRGGAPGTLGDAILDPSRLVQEADAILLTGGSAFGLAAADGVMRWLEERRRGLRVGRWRVPIVLGAVIFDLAGGDGRVRPTARSGYAACEAATRRPEEGRVGAGAGALVAKSGTTATPGGLGIASVRAGRAMVTAIMVVNALGGVWDDATHEWVAPMPARGGGRRAANTTIGVVVTDARLTKTQAERVSVAAHDGLARAVRPAHTDFDGDAIYCLSAGGTRRVSADATAVQAAAADAVAAAIVRGVRLARSPAPAAR